MKEYIKAIGRRRKAIRARKEVEQLVSRLMGNDNYQTYRSNLIKYKQVNDALVALQAVVALSEDNAKLLFSDMNSSMMEDYTAIEFLHKGTTIQKDMTVEVIIAHAEHALTVFTTDNERMTCTPKIRKGLEDMTTLGHEIKSIETEYNIGK